ncbi:MAG: PilZ domain-containing protein [Pseudomonadota bacterium]
MAAAIRSNVSAAASGAERRTFFRVNDAVSLRVTPLNDDTVEQLKQALENRRASGDSEAASAGLHLMWRNIEEHYPDIAAYLVRLEQRLDAIQEQLGNLTDNTPTREPTHTVNISGSGLHFDSEKAFFIGQHVRVSMRLFPSGQTIDALAKVVREHKRSTPVAQGKFGCALEFVDILSSEQEALLQHIHTLQMDALRARAAELD